MQHEMWNLNQKAFERKSAAEWYARQPLVPAEALIFLLFAERIRGARVLDIGVGSGRTTRYLLPLAARYAAIDPSVAMRARLKVDFPLADVRDGDMRRIDNFGDEQFDIIVASCGLLDAFVHEERLQALAAVRGKLAPGGLFVFSAHNRDHPRAGRGPARPAFNMRNPLRIIEDTARYLRDSRNARRLRHMQEDHREYGLLNDGGHDWSLVLYHMSAPAQLRQLTASGFTCLKTYADEGIELDPTQPAKTTSMIHYVAQKAEGDKSAV